MGDMSGHLENVSLNISVYHFIAPKASTVLRGNLRRSLFL